MFVGETGYLHIATLTPNWALSPEGDVSQGHLPSVSASLWLPESSLGLLQMLYLKHSENDLPFVPTLVPVALEKGQLFYSLCPQTCTVGLWVEPVYQ